VFYWIAKQIVRLVTRILYRITIVGLDNVPDKGGAVIVANHRSLMDPPLLGSVLERPVRFMAKVELFKYSALAWLLRRLKAFPVNRLGVDRTAVKEAIATVSSGQLLGIFPEGSRSKDGQLQQGHAGAALVAIKTGVPVVPVGILGLGRNSHGQGLRRHIRLVFGKPIFPPAQEGDQLDRTSLSAFTDDIMKAIADLLA
jgi:1-acyl-sn-glycerol-3-phosphate acyltransferase